jgi:tetratricopeptide (TPR) repeat protein
VYSATGLGLDAGLIRKLSPKWQAGLAISNVVAPSLTLKNSAETYERQVRWGLQWAPSSKVTLAADLAKGEEGAAKLSVGTQWAIAPLVALRAGMNQKEITAGLGLNLGSWNLDYAFGLSNGTPGAERLGPSHRFGLHVAFGQTRTELLWLAQNQKYKPLALKTLADLRGKMSNNVHASTADVEALLTTAAETIRYGGFSDLQNLYEAQAYIFYFQKKYNDAMSYLSQALALGGDNAGEMKINYQTILSEMNGEQRQAALAQELKKATDFYKQGEWKKTLESCRKILEIDPEHIEAREYAEDAQVRLNEPIERAMRIAKAKFERGEYLDVIKNLHLVREQNPENQEAVDLMNRTMEALEKTAVLPPHSVTEIARDTEKSREFFSKGLQYYSQGKLQEALVSWKDAVRYDETNLSAQKAYERALLELGDRP